ncbi:MAG: S8 family serine peptidase, partial [Planctomycetes bacterium]|nr:S8 family serine peptidase [Planctomycetota bacterium]
MRNVIFIASIILTLAGPILAKGRFQIQPVTNGNWYIESIHAPDNIKPEPGAKRVVIAVVDDAIRTTHHDIKDFIWQNPKEVPANNIDDDGNGYVDDVQGWDVSDNDSAIGPPQNRLKEFYHGTHLAGIVARIARSAYGDSASGRIKIMPVKALADSAPKTYIKDGYNGIDYAVKAGADLILCAWSVPHISPDESRILEQARDKGVLLV